MGISRWCGRIGWTRVTLLLLWLLPLAPGTADADDSEYYDLPSEHVGTTWFSAVSILSHSARRKLNRPAEIARDGCTNSAFVSHYRCAEEFATFGQDRRPSNSRGFFYFGSDTVCYGNCDAAAPSRELTNYDAMTGVRVAGSQVLLGFNPSEVVENLRYERYRGCDANAKMSLLRSAYYLARPILGVAVRKHLQRIRLRGWQNIAFPRWPVDSTVETLFEQLLGLMLRAHGQDRIPFVWFWPDDYEHCVTMTHDVETSAGLNYCSQLMDVDDRHALKSSFQIVPEGRYNISPSVVNGIRGRGFEVNLHDLNHDGRLFANERLFLERAQRIKNYAKEYQIEGFRSAILYRNPDWLDMLEFKFDMSSPSSAHLDAQQGGCCSVLPFYVGPTLELPVTTTQDYSLFHILNDYSLDVWKAQMSSIRRHHGLASFIVHPDYIRESRAHSTYLALLDHFDELRSTGNTWFALPSEINGWWRSRNQMTLIRNGSGWAVEGPDKERARVAYAMLDGNRVVFTVSRQSSSFGPNLSDRPRRSGLV